MPRRCRPISAVLALPQLKAAFAYLRGGDALVVRKLSRLVRSLRQAIQTVQDMQARNIDLRVLTQNIDTATPEGRLLFHMTAAFDGFQRELIVENTRAGLAAASRQGRRGGRPRSMDDGKIRLAESLLRDTENHPFVSDVIRQLGIGKTAFHRYFPPERIRELRPPPTRPCQHARQRTARSLRSFRTGTGPMLLYVPLLGLGRKSAGSMRSCAPVGRR